MSNINFFRVMAGNGSQFSSQTIPCNSSGVSFSGKAGEYYSEAIVLGTGIGPITASFNAQGIPDRFILEWSGSTVADSLFVGDQLKNISSYNSYTSSAGSVSNLTRYDYNYTSNSWATGSANSVNFTSASFPPNSADGGAFLRNNSQNLNVNGRGNWGAQKGVLNDYPDSQSSPSVTSASCVEGNVKLCFFKHTQYPTNFTIKSVGWQSNTVWTLDSISCPTGTAVNSSSIMNQSNEQLTIFHTSPTFDLQVGQTLYTDIALSIPLDVNAVTNSFHGEDCWINSGSLLTNPSTYGPWENQCFKTAVGSSTGYSFMTFNSDLAQVGNLFCSASSGRPASLTSYFSSIMGVFNQACPIDGSHPNLTQTYYHDGAGSLPAQGDNVYSDSGGNTALNAGYYNINSGFGVGNRLYIKVTNGAVDNNFPQYC